ncbi:MAG: hypothetical protein GC158_16250 [Cyanobacteria bacterium RI_101]|nr:hypothetical protein [Cyanobacteria bacterium RI_101]
MTQTIVNPEALKTQIKRLNSRAGQMKMDLHDLAEGLPTDYEKLIEMANETYAIFYQLDQLKKQLKTLE